MLDWFDCASCSCNRPTRQETDATENAKYEKWAKSTVQTSNKDVRQVAAMSKVRSTSRAPPQDGEPIVVQPVLSKLKDTSTPEQPAQKAERSASAPTTSDKSPRRANSFGRAFWKTSRNKEQWRTWNSAKELGSGRVASGAGSLGSESFDEASTRQKAQAFHFSLSNFAQKKKAALPAAESTSKKKKEYYGDEAVMLFSYNAGRDTPFPPDPRKELTALQGQKMDILDMRPDGWCLVRKPTGTKEYWLPGNYLSEDGVTPYFVPGTTVA